jgi:predicted AlkP superfamily phosphohydrolase/phosphomutase
MLWHFMDANHPGFEPNEKLVHGIRMIYRELDEALGHVVASIDDDTTLIVMSDHGFGPFNRGVNLNSWLLDKGYAALKNPAIRGKYEGLVNVDWSRTKAYALGLNGLYVNLEGREKYGIVKPGEYQALLDELERELLSMKDPEKEKNAVTLVIQTRRDFHGEHKGDGPDIVVGYGEGYRSSWENPLGKFPEEIFVDNTHAWSGDHSVDYRLVPGTLISNRRITLDEPALYDLTVAILDEYGVSKPEQMIGRDCLGDFVGGQAPAP